MTLDEWFKTEAAAAIAEAREKLLRGEEPIITAPDGRVFTLRAPDL